MPKVIKLVQIVPFALWLGACSGPVSHFGDVPFTAADVQTKQFAMAPLTDTAPVQAVRDALIAAGFHESANAPALVEVGFAVRPRKLEVTASGEDGSHVLSPSAEASLSLCHRQAYVLSVAMIERASGEVQKRMGATTSRCHGTLDEILPMLARTAVNPAR